MATHKVSVHIPTQDLGKADVVFSIKKDSSKLGELRVSNGAAVWFPTSNSYGYKLSWEKLAELFIEHGAAKAEKK